MSSGAGSASPESTVFVTTRWSVVLSAGHRSSPDSARALAELCRQYWYPLYAYIRRQGRSREDAEDLTQAFFARLLETNPLEGLAAAHGRFRAFLLAALKHFLANQWDRSQRQKRGGGAVHLSLDWEDADGRYHLEPADPAGPDHLFDREWALAVLGQVIARLSTECAAAGNGRLFEHTKGFLTLGAESRTYADAARALGMEEGTMRVAVHRLRRRYRDLLREELAGTLADPSMVDEELRSLLAALAG